MENLKETISYIEKAKTHRNSILEEIKALDFKKRIIDSEVASIKNKISYIKEDLDTKNYLKHLKKKMLILLIIGNVIGYTLMSLLAYITKMNIPINYMIQGILASAATTGIFGTMSYYTSTTHLRKKAKTINVNELNDKIEKYQKRINEITEGYEIILAEKESIVEFYNKLTSYIIEQQLRIGNIPKTKVGDKEPSVKPDFEVSHKYSSDQTTSTLHNGFTDNGSARVLK